VRRETSGARCHDGQGNGHDRDTISGTPWRLKRHVIAAVKVCTDRSSRSRVEVFDDSPADGLGSAVGTTRKSRRPLYARRMYTGCCRPRR
jgi:hypothetical protein